MDRYVTGDAIRALREKKQLTQRQLADALMVSDKAVSKWETGRGLPDCTLLEPLAKALDVSLTELISGERVWNANRSANLLRSKCYVCPVCGNVIWAAGEGVFCCCGIRLTPLECEEDDAAHRIDLQRIEDEYFVQIEHPMEKAHAIRFFAYVTCDRVEICRQYPEQNAEARFFPRGPGRIYAYCNRHGLFGRRV